MSGSQVLSVRSGRSTASGTPAACTTPPMVPMAATAASAASARESVSRTSTAMPTVFTPCCGRHRVGRLGGALGVEVPDRHRATDLGDRVRGGEADARGAAGDHDAGRGLELECACSDHAGCDSARPRQDHARSGRRAPVREKIARMTETFAAFTAEKTDDGFRRGVTELTLDDLPDGDVVVDVEWSSVNYKDHLAATEKGRVARISPIVPGIDLAGTVRSSDAAGIAAGRRGDRARLRPRRRPARWVRPGGAGPGGLGRAAARRSHRARGDGRRHRRLHRRALGARAARPRPRRRAPARCW